MNHKVLVTHCRNIQTPPLSGPSTRWGSSQEGQSATNVSSQGGTTCSGRQSLNSHSRQTSAGRGRTEAKSKDQYNDDMSFFFAFFHPSLTSSLHQTMPEDINSETDSKMGAITEKNNLSSKMTDYQLHHNRFLGR
ncbi:hypothetical protein AMECASPLE_027762 [Ameca splendens]|uniref:Uncharacterized protein n=1 Tax=Ameca splendens TaxID=208324 RepID=A0ABV0XIA0_9TELE